MSDPYKYAAQKKLRFPSPKGELSAEQLFQLPLRSETGATDLNTIGKTLVTQLKALGDEEFVADTATSPQKERLAMSIELVRDVVATKQAENKAAADKLAKAAERRRILDVIAAKKDQALTEKSLKELEDQLTALDG